MSERAQALADRFEQANQAVIDAVEAAPDDAWSRMCEGEQCTVAALAYHIAGGHDALVEYIARPIVAGTPLPPISREQIDAGNADNATRNANVSKADALALLRDNGAKAAAFLRGLNDDDLDRSALVPLAGREVAAEAFIENVVIGHPRGHLESMRQAMA
ncbi:MAG TPA: DinB family protein [Thermomicrobiales bacterium]|nr:DinB family protein [Thermomicrobiales bacterium]